MFLHKESGITDVEVEIRESSSLSWPVPNSSRPSSSTTQLQPFEGLSPTRSVSQSLPKPRQMLGALVAFYCRRRRQQRPSHHRSSACGSPAGAKRRVRTQEEHPQNEDNCLMVIKDGSTTGVTIGRASYIRSFVRHGLGNDRDETSMEWPILPYDSDSGSFSKKEDSSAVIIDGLGRIGGLLTAGTGGASPDMTCATPISFILDPSCTYPHSSAHYPLSLQRLSLSVSRLEASGTQAEHYRELKIWQCKNHYVEEGHSRCRSNEAKGM